jgi:hypothetical protein
MFFRAGNPNRDVFWSSCGDGGKAGNLGRSQKLDGLILLRLALLLAEIPRYSVVLTI